MATGSVATRSKKEPGGLTERVLVWRMVHPPSAQQRTPRILNGCDEVTFGLVLPRCWVVMFGWNAGSPVVLNGTHKEKDAVTATQSLFDMTEMVIDRQKGLLVVPPQTVTVVTGVVDPFEWATVPEWAEGVLLPMVDQLHEVAKRSAA